MGVWPWGPQVRRTPASRKKPDSSRGAALSRLPEDARELAALPEVDLRVVALAGAPLGLLAGPAQARVQDAADVIGMIGDAEAPADQFGDAAAGPEVIGPAVGLGALKQELFELLQVGVG